MSDKKLRKAFKYAEAVVSFYPYSRFQCCGLADPEPTRLAQSALLQIAYSGKLEREELYQAIELAPEATMAIAKELGLEWRELTTGVLRGDITHRHFMTALIRQARKL